VDEPNESDIEDEGMHDMMKYVTYTLYKKFLLMSLVVPSMQRVLADYQRTAAVEVKVS
jgi:hypothetical protein